MQGKPFDLNIFVLPCFNLDLSVYKTLSTAHFFGKDI